MFTILYMIAKFPKNRMRFKNLNKNKLYIETVSKQVNRQNVKFNKIV